MSPFLFSIKVFLCLDYQILMQEHALLAFVTLTTFNVSFAYLLLFGSFGYFRLEVDQKVAKLNPIIAIESLESVNYQFLNCFFLLFLHLFCNLVVFIIVTFIVVYTLLNDPFKLFFFFYSVLYELFI